MPSFNVLPVNLSYKTRGRLQIDKIFKWKLFLDAINILSTQWLVSEATGAHLSSFQREWWHILVGLIVLHKQTHDLNSFNPYKPAPQIEMIVFYGPDVCWDKVK